MRWLSEGEHSSIIRPRSMLIVLKHGGNAGDGSDDPVLDVAPRCRLPDAVVLVHGGDRRSTPPCERGIPGGAHRGLRVTRPRPATSSKPCSANGEQGSGAQLAGRGARAFGFSGQDGASCGPAPPVPPAATSLRRRAGGRRRRTAARIRPGLLPVIALLGLTPARGPSTSTPTCAGARGAHGPMPRVPTNVAGAARLHDPAR